MSKEIQKEGLFSATKKFTDAFFDGLKNNAVDRVESDSSYGEEDDSSSNSD
jgi:hypothetical protein